MPLGLAAATLWGGLASGAGALLGAGAGGLMGIGQAKLQQQYNKENMALQHKYNEQSAEEAYRREKEMYQKSFQDQSYETQLALMKKAGLNTGLMYSGGAASGAGGSGAIGGGTQGQGVGLPSVDTSGVISGMGLGSQLGNVASQTILNLANAKKAEADANKTAGVDTEEAQSRTAVNWATLSKITGEVKGQKLQNDYQRVLNRIQRNTWESQQDAILDESDRINHEAFTAAADRITAEENAERAQRTTEEYVEQQALMTKGLIWQLIQAAATVDLTEAQRVEIFENIRLKEEGNDIMWDRNAIEEALGIAGVDASRRGQLISLIGDAVTGAASIYGSYTIARGMLRTQTMRSRVDLRNAARGQTVRRFNSAGNMTGMTTTTME